MTSKSFLAAAVAMIASLGALAFMSGSLASRSGLESQETIGDGAATDADVVAASDSASDGPVMVVESGAEASDSAASEADAADGSSSGLPRLTMSQLSYEGAFRLQLSTNDTSRLGWSDARIALGADAESLFVSGHVGDGAVAEYPMTTPSKATTVEELPLTGPPIQPFVSVLDRAPSGNPQAIDRIGGMLLADGALIVNGYEYYDAPADNTHTTVALTSAGDLDGSSVIGWEEMVGAAHSSGWMSPVPVAWQEALGGTHISGSSSGIPIIGRASVGPSAFVVDLDSSLSGVEQARPVLDFSLDLPLAEDLFNETGTNDVWTHMSRAAYGFVVPGTSTYLTIGSSAGHESGISYGVSPHTESKGYYANAVGDVGPYYWLWDVNDLVGVGQGTVEAHDVRPYEYGPFELPFAEMAGDSRADVGGAAFDPNSGRLFVSISGADDTQNRYEPVPVIAAFSIEAETGGPNGPAPEEPGDPEEPDPEEPGGGTETASELCVNYEASDLFRPRANQLVVGPDEDWESILAAAPAGTDILLEDGEYNMAGYAVYLDAADVTIRSASGNREGVVIRGQGYGVGSEGFMVAAPGVTVADLSMTAFRNHAISIKPEAGAAAIHMYNLNLYDNGTQQIKASSGAENRDGVVACSSIGYTPTGVQGDYIAAIDVHRGVDWVIRDNYIYNVTGDGTGCEIDIDCGTYVSHPAILIWNNSRNTIIERNVIVDSWRAITLGLGNGHEGGRVVNNFIYQSSPGDAGIELYDAHDVVVEHNTVFTVDYQGAIEYGGSTGVTIRNNLLSAPPLERSSRGASTATIDGNITDGSWSDLAERGSPHLAEGSRAIGAGVATTVDTDIDSETRDGRWDVGADQYSTTVVDPDPDPDPEPEPPCPSRGKRPKRCR